MNTRLSKQPFFILFIISIFFFSTCKKEKNKPEGFTANFNTAFTNGGMIPDSILFSASYQDAESYNWNISGVQATGKDVSVKILLPGDYVAEMTASTGSYSETELSFFTLKNYPPNGTSASFLNGSGEVNTVVISASQPPVLPIDSVENLQMAGGMDYDEDNNKLYYTGSIIRSNPNGTQKETILQTDPPGEFIRDVAVDGGDQMVYYSYSLIQEFVDEVYKIPANGGQPEFLFEFQPSVDFLTVKEDDDIVFAVSQGEFNIIIFDPTTGLDSYSSFEGDKYALVWNNTENMLYFVEDIENDGTYDIVKSDPTAANPSTVRVIENVSTEPVLGIDIDEKNQVLYWTDQVQGTIMQLELNNPQAEPKTAFIGISNPRALAIGTFGE